MGNDRSVDDSRAWAERPRSRRQFLRQAAFLGATLPVVGVLASCGMAPGSAPASSGGTAAQPAASPAAASASTPVSSGAAAPAATGGNLSFWIINSSDPATLTDAVNRLQAKDPNVKVDLQSLQNDPFKTKLNVAMGSDSPPDVWNTWGGGVLGNFAQAGAAMDLSAELNKNGWKDRFLPAALNMVKNGDKFYAVPIYVSGSLFFFNKEVFQTNGLTPPTTWDELLKYVAAAKSKNLIPIALANKTRWPGAFYFNYLVDRVMGSDFIDKLTVGKASFNDPGVVEAGRRVQELAKAGAFPEGFNGLDYDTGGSRQLIYAGKAAAELQTTSYPATTKGEMPGFEQKLDFFTFPTLPDGKGDAKSLVGGMIGFAVSQKTKAQPAAMALLQTITDDTARDGYIKNGRVAAIKGGTISDPLVKRISDAISAAPHLQNFWDQALPPELGQEQLDVSQALLGMTITPEAAAQRLDEVAKKVLKA